MRILLFALALFPAAVSAAPTVSAAITGGTLGVGPQIGIRGAHVGVRADATFLNFGVTVRSDDMRYDGRAKLGSAGAMLDLYPFGDRLRFSAGARYNNNQGTVTATPTRNSAIGGLVFTPAQIGTLKARGTVRKAAPAVTLGYGSKPGSGFLWGVDAGALVQGRLRVSALSSSTGLIPQARLDAERAELQSDVNKYRVFPLVQATVGWRF